MYSSLDFNITILTNNNTIDIIVANIDSEDVLIDIINGKKVGTKVLKK